MLIRLAAKTGIAPILQAGKAGALDPHDVQVGQEDWGQKNEGNQLWRMRLTLFAPSPFFCPQSSCPTPALRLIVIKPDKHRKFCEIIVDFPDRNPASFYTQQSGFPTMNNPFNGEQEGIRATAEVASALGFFAPGRRRATQFAPG